MNAQHHDATRPDRLIVVLAATALLLRCLALEQQPLWFDEVNTLYRADAAGLGGVLARLAADVQAPLYDLLMWLVVPWAGTGVWAARLPPALCGAALVPVVAGLVGALGGGRRARLIAAAWVACDPYLVRYGVECRPYALLALASGASLWSAIALVRGRGRGALWLAVSGSALVSTHYYGAPAYGAVLLWVLLHVGAWRGRAGTVLVAVGAPLLVVLAWAPVALHQVSTRSMGAIYGDLDGAMLLSVWDGLCLAAPLEQHGPAWILVCLRVGVGALVLAGGLAATRLWRAAASARHTQLLAEPPSTEGTLGAAGGVAAGRVTAGERLVWRALSVAGALVWLACLALSVEHLADLASAVFKQGRPLDAENRAFLGRLLEVGRLVGAALLVAGLAGARALDALQRLRAAPAPTWLLLGVLATPLLLAGALAAAGQRTLAARNLILAVPAVVSLAALGLAALPRAPRLGLLATLLAAAGLAATRYPDFLVRRDWPAVAHALEAAGAPEPLAHPPWIARCLEHALGRPWLSVEGSYRPEEVSAWAQGLSYVALVSAYQNLSDPAPLRELLVRRFGRPRRLTVTTGVVVELFGEP